MSSDIIKEHESNVRSYSRSFPVTFTQAKNARLIDDNGNSYIDFLAGAGSLNYGHNNEVLKAALIEYLESDGICHGLDMATSAKEHFIEAFQELVVSKLKDTYKIQFTGPTGTNAVEAAMKIARNVTGRENIIAFSHSFHGVTLGSVAATANSHYRDATGTNLSGVTFMPYDGYLGEGVDSAKYLEKVLADSASGIDLPAAVLLETIQGEGGINVASPTWLRSIEKVCRKFDVLLIVDDIQMGCGRTGQFFSFTSAGIRPDIITLSKSLSGYGLPFSVVLLKPEFDTWKPGEHNGTFRGNNLAFVTATKALEHFWRDSQFANEVTRKSKKLRQTLEDIVADSPNDLKLKVRGRGFVQAIDCVNGDLADAVTSNAFEKGLIIETSGANDEVVKVLAPLTIPDSELEQGLSILKKAFAEETQKCSAEKNVA